MNFGNILVKIKAIGFYITFLTMENISLSFKNHKNI